MSGAGYTPQQVSAPTSSQLAGYMNPFTSSVINATLPIMQQNLGLSQDQQQNAASSANAYGGSRAGNSTRGHPGSGRHGHGPDGGAVKPSQFRPGDGRGAAGQPGQPVGRPRRQCSADRRGPRARQYRRPADAEQPRQLRHADLGWRSPGAAAAEHHQRPDLPIGAGARLSRAAARGPRERARHDALQYRDLGHFGFEHRAADLEPGGDRHRSHGHVGQSCSAPAALACR